MSDRNRIIYDVLAVFASQVDPEIVQTGDGDIKQLSRVQSWDDDFSRNLEDITQFGNLAAIDKIETESPTVNASLSYYLTNGSNEKYLGFTLGQNGFVSCVSGILSKVSDERNYYLLIAEEGFDANGYIGATSGVIGVGNGFITDYTLEASVGAIPSVSVSLEGLNVAVYADANGTDDVPAVNPVNGLPIVGVPFRLPQGKTDDVNNQVSALRYGDVELNITGVFGWNIPSLRVQSCSLNIPLSRTPLQKLGNRFPTSREIDFPLNATFSVEAELGELENFNLNDLFCETGTYGMSLKFRNPDCQGSGDYAFIVDMRGAKVISKSDSFSIGSNGTVSIEYQIPIGGSTDTVRGISMSGSLTGVS